MFAQAIQGIVESKDFARAADIAVAAHFSKTNPSSQPNRWKKTGLIFAVPYKGADPICSVEPPNDEGPPAQRKPGPAVDKSLLELSKRSTATASRCSASAGDTKTPLSSLQASPHGYFNSSLSAKSPSMPSSPHSRSEPYNTGYCADISEDHDTVAAHKTVNNA
jgi:hypothetical protein